MPCGVCEIGRGAEVIIRSEGAPPSLKAFLVDAEDLCGAFCVWLTKDGEGGKDWLSGRFLVANWDVDELEAKKDEIVERDSLKMALKL